MHILPYQCFVDAATPRTTSATPSDTTLNIRHSGGKRLTAESTSLGVENSLPSHFPRVSSTGGDGRNSGENNLQLEKERRRADAAQQVYLILYTRTTLNGLSQMQQ